MRVARASLRPKLSLACITQASLIMQHHQLWLQHLMNLPILPSPALWFDQQNTTLISSFQPTTQLRWRWTR